MNLRRWLAAALFGLVLALGACAPEPAGADESDQAAPSDASSPTEAPSPTESAPARDPYDY